MEKSMEEQEVISVDQIYTILNNYRIGKKPLAKLLGWGETTIIRYVEGDVPTNEYSDKLLMILKNPGYFYELLQKNQDNITKVAYKKCRKAVLKQLLESKICVVAQYIINKREAKINIQELQNYLYYTQSFSLALYDYPMFEDEYIFNSEEMPFERVAKDFATRKISILELTEDSLNDYEKELVEQVIAAFDWYGPQTMKNLTTFERAMLKVSRDKRNKKIVSKEALKFHFNDILLLYDIKEPKEIHKYPDKRFLEIRNVC